MLSVECQLIPQPPDPQERAASIEPGEGERGALFFLKIFSAMKKIQEPKLVTFPKFYGEHFDIYCGVAAGRLLLW